MIMAATTIGSLAPLPRQMWLMNSGCGRYDWIAAIWNIGSFGRMAAGYFSSNKVRGACICAYEASRSISSFEGAHVLFSNVERADS